VIVRGYTDADFNQIKQLHADSGLRYTLPPLPRSEFYSRTVVQDSSGIGMATFMRLTSEVYLVCNPNWRTPPWRMEALRKLHFICNRDAKEQGVKEVCAFLPPEMVKKFGGRLTRMGWSSYKGADWKCFGHEVT
jgi:hypothetical protein